MHKIVCPTPGHALMLATVLEHEGHPSYWAMVDGLPRVVTMAPSSAIRAAASTFAIRHVVEDVS